MLFPRLSATLATPKLLSLGRAKMKNFVFLFAFPSLIRNFAGRSRIIKKTYHGTKNRLRSMHPLQMGHLPAVVQEPHNRHVRHQPGKAGGSHTTHLQGVSREAGRAPGNPPRQVRLTFFILVLYLYSLQFERKCVPLQTETSKSTRIINKKKYNEQETNYCRDVRNAHWKRSRTGT